MPVFKTSSDPQESIVHGHVRDPDFKHPDAKQKATPNRPKNKRIILHSEDRINYSSDPAQHGKEASKAMFNLGDLKAQWNLKQTNVDAGEVYWDLIVSYFSLTTVEQPKIVEVRGLGFPFGADSWDSASEGTSTLLTFVAGTGLDDLGAGGEYEIKAHMQSDAPIALTQIPGGTVTILLSDRDGTDFAADPTLKWTMILTLTPCKDLQ